jgi:hypothetical protein
MKICSKDLEALNIYVDARTYMVKIMGAILQLLLAKVLKPVTG